MPEYSSDTTYTLEDLEGWDRQETSLAVLGFPVRHSISPAMHNAALAGLLPNNPQLAGWKYFRFEVRPEHLVAALPLFHRKGFFGLNLTVPHKEVAFPAIEKANGIASSIMAVNTLRRTDTGFEGFNTDGYGLLNGIKEQLGLGLAGANVVLLGAGGAARAAAAQCIESRCASLTIVNRSPERLKGLIDALRPLADAAGVTFSGYAPNDPELRLPAGSLLINATSLGLKADDPLPLPAELIAEPVRLYDMIYNPAVTPLMSKVAAARGRSANGLSMLIHQGVRALEIWTGQPVSAAIMGQAARAALGL